MGSVVVFQPVGFFEIMPLIMIQRAVPVPIQSLENIGCGLGKIGFELLPVYQVITIQIHIPEVSIK